MAGNRLFETGYYCLWYLLWIEVQCLRWKRLAEGMAFAQDNENRLTAVWIWTHSYSVNKRIAYSFAVNRRELGKGCVIHMLDTVECPQPAACRAS